MIALDLTAGDGLAPSLARRGRPRSSGLPPALPTVCILERV